jgi:hypothetical protein
MDNTVQTYLNEYISLIGKGKFMLFGGNQFLDAATGPKAIDDAIDKYTTKKDVPVDGVFDRRLKKKEEIIGADGKVGSADDATYKTFVDEWKGKGTVAEPGIQKQLVLALIKTFEDMETAKGSAAAKAPGLFGGVFTTPVDALKGAANVAGVVAVTETIHPIIAELSKVPMTFTLDMMKGDSDKVLEKIKEYIEKKNTSNEDRNTERDFLVTDLNTVDCSGHDDENQWRDFLVVDINSIDYKV